MFLVFQKHMPQHLVPAVGTWEEGRSEVGAEIGQCSLVPPKAVARRTPVFRH